MPTFKSAAQLAQFHRKRVRRIGDSVAVAHFELVQGLERQARLATSGSTKTKMLRYLDHPFARRHGKARIPTLPINIQSGRLQRSFRIFKRVSKGDKVYQFRAMARHAKFVLSPQGTRTMLLRRFWAWLREWYVFASRTKYRQALRRANRS